MNVLTKSYMGDYSHTIRIPHLSLQGYNYFITSNTLIPIKTNTIIGLSHIPYDIPSYYYVSDYVYTNNILTKYFWDNRLNGHLIDHKLLFFPYQTYQFKIIHPTRKSNIYDIPNIGKIELNDPEHEEPWFDHEVCIIFDEGFVPPKVGTIHQDIFNLSGLVEDMLRENSS